jgi:mono/diheme cytochrome c family protein
MGAVRGRCFAAIAVALAAHAAPQPAPDFAREIQPIFAAKCLACHGSKMQMHGLRLDRRADALRGGESGVPAIVPGNSAQSLLIRYVSGGDPKVIMPPSGPRLTAEQIALLRAWIDGGATWPGDAGPVSEAPRRSNHWAFQPLSRPAVPDIKSDWVRNPIDAFVLQKLRAHGMNPAPPAEAGVLRRRVYMDLTGLPPTLAEQSRPFDVDELLARPTYGERWARHWLDLVRFAETNGYERDATKPNAWRYRDYVIRAFNSDKPFDRFVLEQLAGDELPDASAETFTALGYYRLGPWDDEPADPATDRFDQLDDVVSTTSQVFLGLTLGCARCHNHKFEPLSARDYYSMVALFNGLQRPQKGRTELDLPAGTWAEFDAIQERDRQVEPLEKRLQQIRSSARRPWLESGKSKLPAAAIQAFLLDPAKLNDDHKKLIKTYTKQLDEEVAESLTPAQKDEIELDTKRIESLRRSTPDGPRAYYLYEPKPQAPPTFLLVRGKADQPGPEVTPGVPEVLHADPLHFPAPGRTSMRRLTFAEWLVAKDNPLTARVIVNRIWQHHFGEGLVRTPSDFGVMGEKPTHPELLDWLAGWFMDNGWSIKKLHRLILNSNAYRMGKQWNTAYAEKDPENKLLWRMPYQRLEVEAIRDSALAASGRLNLHMYGPSMYPHIPPAALEGSSDPDKIWKESDEKEASRRTIYAFLKRSMVVPMLEVMDLCDTSRTAARRQNTSVPTQALTLFNGDFVNRQARHFADRLRKEAGDDPAKQVDLAYRLALARPARPSEIDTMVEFLKREPLEQMCRVIFNLNEFAYVD